MEIVFGGSRRPDSSDTEIIGDGECMMDMSRDQFDSITSQPIRRQCEIFVVKLDFQSGKFRLCSIVVMDYHSERLFCLLCLFYFLC